MFRVFARLFLIGTLAGLLVFFGRMLWDMVDSDRLWHPVKEV